MCVFFLLLLNINYCKLINLWSGKSCSKFLYLFFFAEHCNQFYFVEFSQPFEKLRYSSTYLPNRFQWNANVDENKWSVVRPVNPVVHPPFSLQINANLRIQTEPIVSKGSGKREHFYIDQVDRIIFTDRVKLFDFNFDLAIKSTPVQVSNRAHRLTIVKIHWANGQNRNHQFQ